MYSISNSVMQVHVMMYIPGRTIAQVNIYRMYCQSMAMCTWTVLQWHHTWRVRVILALIYALLFSTVTLNHFPVLSPYWKIIIIIELYHILYWNENLHLVLGEGIKCMFRAWGSHTTGNSILYYWYILQQLSPLSPPTPHPVWLFVLFALFSQGLTHRNGYCTPARVRLPANS